MTTINPTTTLLSLTFFLTSCCSIFPCAKDESSLTASKEAAAKRAATPAEISGDPKTRDMLDGVWQRAIRAIKDKDATTLSAMTHPVEGIRFGPYGTVQASTDVTLDAEQIANFFKTKNRLTWGTIDGTGEPINMTPSEYYTRFIYNVDYLNPEKISFDAILGRGNAVENTLDVYPDAHTVEFYFSGFNPEYNGMDWQSLRIVFQKHHAAWFIVAIVHNEWTT